MTDHTDPTGAWDVADHDHPRGQFGYRMSAGTAVEEERLLRAVGAGWGERGPG